MKREKKAKRKKSKLRENVEAVLFALVIALFIKTFIVDVYKIPTGSMIPTIEVGDFIVATKFIYGAKIPFTKKRLPAVRDPRRGDIIIFLAPYYDPPNMTYPFGAYLCVMDIDVDTGVYKVRRFYALDDCGTRINPMIIEGQVHGGLTEAFAIAMGQEIRYDDTGNVVTGSFMDFFMPTAVETPHWETDFTVTPSPHHPIGAKGVGESPNVGGVPAFSNAVNDAFSFLGSTHIQMPHDYWRNWKAAKDLGAVA